MGSSGYRPLTEAEKINARVLIGSKNWDDGPPSEEGIEWILANVSQWIRRYSLPVLVDKYVDELPSEYIITGSGSSPVQSSPNLPNLPNDPDSLKIPTDSDTPFNPADDFYEEQQNRCWDDDGNELSPEECGESDDPVFRPDEHFNWDEAEESGEGQSLVVPPPCPEDEEQIICAEGTSETRNCGEGDLGTQTRTCTNNTWGDWSACVMPQVTPDPVYPNGNGKVRYFINPELSENHRSPIANRRYNSSAIMNLHHILALEPPHIQDKIRMRSGKQWGNAEWDGNNNTDALHQVSFLSEREIEIKPNMNLMYWPAFGLSAWNEYANDTIPSSDIEFEDHVFKITSPMTKAEFDRLEEANSIKSLYANLRPEYNFYEPKYEEVSLNVGEKLLPNIYSFVHDISHNPGGYAGTTADWSLNYGISMQMFQVTLATKIPRSVYRPMMMPLSEDSENRSSRRIKKGASDNYFRFYASLYDWEAGSLVSQAIEGKINKHYSNLLVTHSNFNLLEDYNSKRAMFPMYFELEFSTDTETEFAEILKDTDLGCTLMKSAVMEQTTGASFQEYLLDPSSDPTRGTYAGLQVRNSIDITEWFSNIDSIVPPDEAFDGVFLGVANKDMQDTENQFYRAMTSVIFNGKLQEMSKVKTRTIQEIFEGQLARSEAVMYGIEKTDDSGNVIQSFYLPNSNEIDVLRFIDTQVQYGKRYTYKVYVWQLVFGTKYSYTNSNTTAGKITIKISPRPSIKLFEVPYYEYSNKIMDKPPVQPNVDLIPFRGVNDKIKINLSPNTGTYNLLPVVFNPEEQAVVDEMLINQERDSGELEGILEYRSDDEASMYEVYRIDFHPKSYQDFIGKKIKSVNPDVNLNEPGSATSASMHDKLIPNKKYWYTFRSVDNHGHISYPTPVYKVEIIDDDGAIYPIIEVVDFKGDELTQNSKNLKKIMQISPAFPQALLDTEDTDTYKLGVREDSVWGKTFKIRLTSKKTGKKVDLKVKFEHKRID